MKGKIGFFKKAAETAVESPSILKPTANVTSSIEQPNKLAGMIKVASRALHQPATLLNDTIRILDLKSNRDHISDFLSAANLKADSIIPFKLSKICLTDVATTDPVNMHQTISRMHDKLRNDGTISDLNNTYTKINIKNKPIAQDIFHSLFEEELPSEFLKYPLIRRAYELNKNKQLKFDADNFNILTFLIRESLTQHEFYESINKAAARCVSQAIDNGECKSLARVSSDTARTVYLAGPSGTGKTSITKEIIEKGVLEMDQFARFTPDDYNTILLERCGFQCPDDLSLNTASELYHYWVKGLIINDAENTLIAAKQNGEGVNRFRELIVPEPEHFTADKNTYCAVTHNKHIQLVFKGVEERAKATGRDVHHDYIVNGYNQVSRTMPKNFAAVLGANNQSRIEIYDTSYIHTGAKKPELPVAICDSKSKHTIIFSIDEMIELNSHKHWTYPIVASSDSNDKRVTEFIHDYSQIIDSLVFINPKITADQSLKIDEHCYAYVDKNSKKLIIKNQTVYDSVCKDSPTTGLYFKELSHALELSQQTDLGRSA